MEKYLKDLPVPVYIHIYPLDPDFIPERFDKEYSRQVRLERQRVSTGQLWLDFCKNSPVANQAKSINRYCSLQEFLCKKKQFYLS